MTYYIANLIDGDGNVLYLFKRESNRRYTRVTFRDQFGLSSLWTGDEMNIIHAFDASSVEEAWDKYRVYVEMTR